MAKCTYCGADIPEGRRYCPVCHAAVPTNYDDKGVGDYSGTYGHTHDEWGLDESRYRSEESSSAYFDSGEDLHGHGTYESQQPTQTRSNPSGHLDPTAPSSYQPDFWTHTPDAGSVPTKDPDKVLFIITLIVSVLVLVFINVLPIVFTLVGYFRDRAYGSGRTWYLLALVWAIFGTISTIIAGSGFLF